MTIYCINTYYLHSLKEDGSFSDESFYDYIPYNLLGTIKSYWKYYARGSVIEFIKLLLNLIKNSSFSEEKAQQMCDKRNEEFQMRV